MKYLLPLIIACANVFAVAGKISDVKGTITPNAGPRVDHGIDVFLNTDFIYWTPRMDGLAYAITGSGDGVSSTPRGSVKHLDWNWAPGFKVGAGLNLPHDGWDVTAEYTWLYSSADHKKAVSGSDILSPWNVSNLVSLLSNSEIREARADWDIHFHTAHLSLGRNYFISNFLTLRPFVGFKGSWIDQDYRVRYTLEGTIDSNLRMKNDQDFWGIGLRTGLDTGWQLTSILSLYGNFAISGLWSQFQVDRKDTRNDSNNPGGGNSPLNTNITVLNSEDDFHTIKGVIEFGLGLRAEWWFFDDRYHFLIQGGWEEQLWINHNNLLKTYFAESDHGDLILQGFTMKLRFDF
ncbi:Lpg1974 family pore-forming outer membrane protein [Candidatus Neptunochlamydia vexilliferae]|nr:Lpg1974 family pore-forming outer membrane protein [Candidatus Neptunochlamydia vexilliferae]